MTDWKQKATEAWEQPGWDEARREYHARKQTPQSKSGDWPEPKPLPTGLLPVEPYRSEFMPAALAPWVDDISERLQCPADYVAVASVVALGSVIGRRIGIKPQARTDWLEVPNLWGCFIGRPGMLKSPAMMAALKPIHRLERKRRRAMKWRVKRSRRTWTFTNSKSR